MRKQIRCQPFLRLTVQGKLMYHYIKRSENSFTTETGRYAEISSVKVLRTNPLTLINL